MGVEEAVGTIATELAFGGTSNGGLGFGVYSGWGRRGGWGEEEVAAGDAVDIDDEVDAIEDGTGETLVVSGNLSGGAGAGVIRITVVATGTGVHGGDEHEIGWVGGALIGAGKSDLAIFEGLAKRFEDVAGVFGEFVEKENAAMGKGDFPWMELEPTTQNGGCAGGMMGRTKGALSKIGGGSRGEGMEFGDFDLLGRSGWREQGSGATG